MLSLAALCALGSVLFWSQVSAQSADRTLIIPTSAAGPRPWIAPTVEALAQELRKQRQQVWAPSEAADVFEAQSSMPPPTLSQQQIDRWVKRSRSAIVHLAHGEYTAAHRDLRIAQALSDEAAEELNREAARSQQVLDTCLYVVRAFLETNDHTQARNQARECRRLVPRGEASHFRHPPEVRALLKRVDDEFALESPGQLVVRSTPSNCVVRINGIEIGKTPLKRSDIPVGAYRLQVECDPERRGRIHPIEIRAGRSEIFVNAEFEDALETRPYLYLKYTTPEDEDGSRLRHASQIREVLGAEKLVLLSATGPKTLRIDLRDHKGQATSAWLELKRSGPDKRALAKAVKTLLAGTSIDHTGSRAVARAAWGAESVPAFRPPKSKKERAPRQRREKAKRLDKKPGKTKSILGWTALGVGVAGLATGYGLHMRRNNLGEDWEDDNVSNAKADDWINARPSFFALAALGGAASTSALPLILPEYERPPWWSWLSGGVGLGLTGYLLYEVATLSSCQGRQAGLADAAIAKACVERENAADRAMILGATAAPLLALPLVYVVRGRKRLHSSLTTGHGYVMFRVEGAF